MHNAVGINCEKGGTIENQGSDIVGRDTKTRAETSCHPSCGEI